MLCQCTRQTWHIDFNSISHVLKVRSSSTSTRPKLFRPSAPYRSWRPRSSWHRSRSWSQPLALYRFRSLYPYSYWPWSWFWFQGSNWVWFLKFLAESAHSQDWRKWTLSWLCWTKCHVQYPGVSAGDDPITVGLTERELKTILTQTHLNYPSWPNLGKRKETLDLEIVRCLWKF